MYEVDDLSFGSLEQRELLKGWVWWFGFVAAVTSAAATYCKATGVE